jgi:hypothetical protein
MKMPGFTAEASLGPAIEPYRGGVLFGSTRQAGVSPSQQSTAASLLGIHPWQKRVHCCCYDFYGRPFCSYRWVPIWYDCETTSIGDCYSCEICHPPVNELA